MDFYGNELWNYDREITMKANFSKVYFTKEFNDIVKKHNENKIFLHVKILENGQLHAENNLFFAKIKDLMLPKSEIKYNTVYEHGKFGVKMISDVFTKNVFIDYPDDKGNFSDNYFDLLPGELKTIWVDLDKEEFKKVHIKSLLSLKRNN